MKDYKTTQSYKMLNAIDRDIRKLILKHLNEDASELAMINFNKDMLKLEKYYNSIVEDVSDKDVNLIFNRYKRDYNKMVNNAVNNTAKVSLLNDYSLSIQSGYGVNMFDNNKALVNTFTNGARKDMRKLLINSNDLLSSGTITRKQALDKVIDNYKGPTVTFNDGKQYPAKAYYETVIQDTQMQESRELGAKLAEEFDTEVYLYSERTPATNPREVCSFLEGKLVAIGWSGTIKDGNGNEIEVYDLYDYNYGEPGGALGIRCGHDLFPFIPGVSIL